MVTPNSWRGQAGLGPDSGEGAGAGGFSDGGAAGEPGGATPTGVASAVPGEPFAPTGGRCGADLPATGMMIGLISPVTTSRTMQVFGLARNSAPGLATSVLPVRCCSRTWVWP